MKVTEAGVASGAERWLRENGYDVYREVRDGYGGARADLVGRRGSLVHVVECKTRLSLALIDQAAGWLGRAQLVSVAVPRHGKAGRYKKLRKYPLRALRCLGVGLLVVDSPDTPYVNAFATVRARWHGLDPRQDPVSSLLHEEQKVRGEAGTSRGGYVTAFSLTMDDAAAFVAANPGATIREAVAGIDHHYSHDKSARQGLCFALKRGLVPGTRLDTESRPWRAYPEEPEA